jgi:hypothetical protein
MRLHRVIRPLEVAGRSVAPGATIALDYWQARPLLAAGFVRRLPPPVRVKRVRSDHTVPT